MSFGAIAATAAAAAAIVRMPKINTTALGLAFTNG
jgi:hypothetical protein